MVSENSLWIDIKPLGISVTPLTACEAAAVAAHSSGKKLLLNHNLHSAYLHETDSDFCALYRLADWVVIDGTPIRWLASLSLSEKLKSRYRIGSTDWIPQLANTEVARRLFVYGSTAVSNRRAVGRLQELLPDWLIAGIDGYGAPDGAIRRMSEFDPDIVLIGLGMPLQEHFLLRNWSILPDATYATVGGAIDYLSGTTRIAPRWLAVFGLEWAWRFINEPKRLAHRYLVEPFLLLARAFRRRTSR